MNAAAEKPMNVACLWFEATAPTEQIAELCLRFSPQIALRRDRAVFIEIGKCHRLYSRAGFLARLRVVLRRLGLTGRVGFGFEVTDALLRARYRTDDTGRLPLTALHLLADPFDRDPVLQPYIEKMISAFGDLGVATLAQFQALPPGGLAARFGPAALLCRQRCRAETPLSWPYWAPAEVISEKTEFGCFEQHSNLEPLLFELKKQLDLIFPRLYARGRRLQKLRVRIFCEVNSVNPEPFREFTFDFLFPQGATRGALAIVKERLYRDFQEKPVRTPLEGIECLVLETVPGHAAQRHLLHRHDEIAEQRAALLAQLTEAHGPGKIFQAELVEDRRAECSWRPVSTRPRPLRSNLELPLRPTHLAEPEPLPVQRSEAGSRVYLHGHWHRLTARSHRHEAELISGGWQEDPADLENSYHRRYHRFELADGTRLWVYQDAEGDYFLHGYFG